MDLGTAILMFSGAGLLATVVTFFVLELARRQPLQAAVAMVIIATLAALGIVQIVDSYWYILPAAAGTAVATYVVLRFVPLAERKRRR